MMKGQKMTDEKEERLVRKRVTLTTYDDPDVTRELNSDRIFGKRSFINIRTNAASLLKDAALILKEEEEETKKLMNLLIGSANYLEYEKMIEERIAEEKELFRLKMERLHLEGKLTEKAAILAKQRLLHDSRERRKLFEKERKEYLEDVEKLKAIEKERALNLVSKVKEINRRATVEKKNVFESKKIEGEKNREELQKMIKEAFEKGKEEYQKKVLMIKQLRAFQAFKKSLQCLSPKKKQEQPKIGLLCEMSLEELASRKELMRTWLSEECSRRRQMIFQKIRRKEMLLDDAERFIREARIRRKLKRDSKQNDFQLTEKESYETIPETFLRPIPPITKTERVNKEKQSMLKTLNEIMVKEKRKEIARRKMICEKEKQLKAIKLNKMLATRFEDNRDKNRIRREYLNRLLVEEKLGMQTCQQNEDGFGKELLIRKLSTRKAKHAVFRQEPDESPSMDIYKVLWSKFKWFITTKTRYKLPKRLNKLISPPKMWVKLLNSYKGIGTTSNRRKSVASRKGSIRHSHLRSKRIIQFKKTSGYRKPRPVRAGRRRKNMKRSEKRIFGVWKWFCHRVTDNPANAFGGLERLNDSYTKKVIKKVNFFYKLLNKTFQYEKMEEVSPSIAKYREDVLELKAKLRELTGRVGRKRLRDKARDKKQETPLRHRLVLPPESGVKEQQDFYRNPIPLLPDNVRQLFAEEDKEIIETPLEIPLRGKQQKFNWFTEGDLEREEFKEGEKRREKGPPIIHVWQVPSIQKKRPKKKREMPLELKLLSQHSDKYTLLRNKFDNPVFTLRPVASNPLKWEWVPVIKRREEGEEEAKKAVETVKSVNTAAMAFIRAKSLELPQRLTPPYITDHSYMRSLRGPRRRQYFRNVPIKMVLDYWRTNRYGGNPKTESPKISSTKINSIQD